MLDESLNSNVLYGIVRSIGLFPNFVLHEQKSEVQQFALECT
jgi:hypothetical protein